MNLKCIIIDDEPLAVTLLTGYIARIPDIQLVESISNSIAAISVLQKTHIDLIFLDIEMPQLNGIDFLKGLLNKPAVIITSAHRHYAMDGFEHDVVDFLLKPISFDRFIKGISKIYQFQQILGKNTNQGLIKTNGDASLHFRVEKEMIRVFLKDILWIESIKDYVKIITVDNILFTYQRISYLEARLPEDFFIRIHRSFIISTGKITSIGSDFIKINLDKIPIGRNYKKLVREKLMPNNNIK